MYLPVIAMPLNISSNKKLEKKSFHEKAALFMLASGVVIWGSAS
jgi:hypothetical protein